MKDVASSAGQAIAISAWEDDATLAMTKRRFHGVRRGGHRCACGEDIVTGTGENNATPPPPLFQSSIKTGAVVLVALGIDKDGAEYLFLKWLVPNNCSPTFVHLPIPPISPLLFSTLKTDVLWPLVL